MPFSRSESQKYCKNLTFRKKELNNRQVIMVAGESAMIAEIFCGIDSRKCTKVVDEMRLVKIAAVQRDIAPTYGSPAGNLFQYGLESSYTAEHFWSHSYVLFEEFDKPPRTEAGFVRDFSNLRGGRLGQEIFHSVLNGWVPIKHARGSFE